MIKLSPFEQPDFERFKSWIVSEELLAQFAGSIFNYPVTDEQLWEYSNDSRRIPFKVVSTKTDDILGHCELNFEHALPRLSRILIADQTNRSKGIGKLVVHQMLEKLFIDKAFESADLNVFDWNKAAIRCYQQIGFVIAPETTFRQNTNGEIWTVLNMTISKQQWLTQL